MSVSLSGASVNRPIERRFAMSAIDESSGETLGKVRRAVHSQGCPFVLFVDPTNERVYTQIPLDSDLADLANRVEAYVLAPGNRSFLPLPANVIPDLPPYLDTFIIKDQETRQEQIERRREAIHRISSQLPIPENLPWLLAAVKCGDSGAINDVGAVYASLGKEVESKRWFQRAASKGVAQAQSNLALQLLGSSKEQDHRRATELLESAAEQGMAQAQYNLGQIYYRGECGVGVDLDKARGLIEAAADQGFPEALYALGLHHLRGTGGYVEDWVIAAEYMRRAAAAGNEKAQENLWLSNLYGKVQEATECFSQFLGLGSPAV